MNCPGSCDLPAADADRTVELFFELFSGLPRQGPGDSESTRRALSLLPPLSPAARILDIGSGTGAQTLDLATFSPANITAIDLHAPFVNELNARAARLGVGDRVHASVRLVARLLRTIGTQSRGVQGQSPA
jgi:methylase of polypeptide subunit release factors